MPVKKILLVDDVKFFLDLEKNYLAKTDCEIFTALNGKDALKIAMKEKPDLIFIDFEMPEMNGLQYLDAAAEHEDIRDIPAVVVSAFVDGNLEEQVKEAGACGILKKPFTQDAFIRIVNQLLQLDRRNRDRHRVDVPAFFGFEDKMDKGKLLDLSEGGAFIATETPLKGNTFLELKFLLGSEETVIKSWCRVVWLNESKGRRKVKYPTGMGVEFVGLTKETLHILQEYFKAMNKENGS